MCNQLYTVRNTFSSVFICLFQHWALFKIFLKIIHLALLFCKLLQKIKSEYGALRMVLHDDCNTFYVQNLTTSLPTIDLNQSPETKTFENILRTTVENSDELNKKFNC